MFSGSANHHKTVVYFPNGLGIGNRSSFDNLLCHFLKLRGSCSVNQQIIIGQLCIVRCCHKSARDKSTRRYHRLRETGSLPYGNDLRGVVAGQKPCSPKVESAVDYSASGLTICSDSMWFLSWGTPRYHPRV